VRPAPFWAEPVETLFARTRSGPGGLTNVEVRTRLTLHGPNRIGDERQVSALALLVHQLVSPLILILLFGACVSLWLGQWVDASIIFVIVLGSALLTFFQEYRASRAIAALRARLKLTSRTLRNGEVGDIACDALVPGDVVLLSAGNLVPADGRILEASDFLVTEAALTGESLPVEKKTGTVAAGATVSERTNSVFMGSSVRSGTARVLLVETGARTQFGAIAARLRRSEPETDFARGVRHFGMMLLRVMVVIVLGVMTVNQLLGRPLAESLLFAVALAVGLSPELLPAIVTVTLSMGARGLAREGVIVRRLEAIENLGSMDVLCTDKTGTLTQGTVSLAAAICLDARPSRRVREAAFINAWFETGIANPLDAALVAAARAEHWSPAATGKRGEIPYDFQRRRLSVVVQDAGCSDLRIVTKGAFADMLGICTTVEIGDARIPLNDHARTCLATLFQKQGEAGFRVLAVAERLLPADRVPGRDDEREMTLLGLLAFADPPKADAARALQALASLGVAIKVISGDNRYIAVHVARAVGLDPAALLTGKDIAAMSAPALLHHVRHATLFVEIDPQQKERIVRALQRNGHAVGFLGDGINDAPALHVADVGISVDGAVDVARESADIILSTRDLDVLRQGVERGRRTFANTLKYIAIATSSTFGNMVSMALATPFLPFLPLLPKQILLNNFLSDLPSLAISTDRVDAEQIATPQRWEIRRVRRFMILFGLLSSCFDALTFGILLLVLRADARMFHTAWFVISLLTELAVLLILRTRRPVLRSVPGRLLWYSMVPVLVAACALPWTGALADLFGLMPMTPGMIAATVAVLLGFALATEFAKRRWYATGSTQHSGFNGTGAPERGHARPVRGSRRRT